MSEHIKFVNPFSRIRAEQMGDSAWKYFVRVPFKEYIAEKPLIYEGSRGSGKTMFFLCNSWREKLKEATALEQDIISFLQNQKHIGFYYKADGRFCSSFHGKGISDDNWVSIFNTYFNCIILIEIIDFIETVNKDINITNEILLPLLHKIAILLKRSPITDLAYLKEIIDIEIIEIEHFCNDTQCTKPVGTNPGSIIERVLKDLKKISWLKNTTFHIFIDEYEIFQEYQQREINTLLKQSDSDIVYDFGVITKGMHTYETKSEQKIQPKDDFLYFRPDHLGYDNSNQYNDLLYQICNKRLEIIYSQLGLEVINPEYCNINFYLRQYDREVQEELILQKSVEIDLLKDRIKLAIDKYKTIYEQDVLDVFFQELINCSIIHMRIHLALLCRKDVEPKMLVQNKLKNSAKYKDWIHNMSNAVEFMLCHEFKVEKIYTGFKVYSALSAGVIRSFLELAEYAFDYAKNNGFDFSNPRNFTWSEQTEAVMFVSRYKVAEIDSYGPNGITLGKFTKALGKIFYNLHTQPNATLGENEQNHFITEVKDIELHYKETYDHLRRAVMYNIIQEEESTKTKNTDDIEYMDYHLNHIYCPFFKISHWRKRKLQIKAEDVAKLLSGRRQVLNEVVNKYSGNLLSDTPNLFNQ